MENDELLQVFEREAQSILRAISALAEQVKDVENRMRALEISNSSVISQIQTQIGTLAERQRAMDTAVDKLLEKQRAQADYSKAIQAEVVIYVKELLDQYMKVTDFAEWQLKDAENEDKKWLGQEDLNSNFRAARTFFWAAAGITMAIIIGFIWQLIVSGGVKGLIP